MDVSRITPQSTLLTNREQTPVELPLQNQESRQISTDLTSDLYTPTAEESGYEDGTYERLITMRTVESAESVLARSLAEGTAFLQQRRIFLNHMKSNMSSLDTEVDKFYKYLRETNPSILQKDFDFGYKNGEIVVKSQELDKQEIEVIQEYIQENDNLKSNIYFFGRDMYALSSGEATRDNFFIRDFQSFAEERFQARLEFFSDVLNPYNEDEIKRDIRSMLHEQVLGYFF